LKNWRGICLLDIGSKILPDVPHSATLPLKLLLQEREQFNRRPHVRVRAQGATNGQNY